MSNNTNKTNVPEAKEQPYLCTEWFCWWLYGQKMIENQERQMAGK